jgi:hypothetical protein
MPFDRLKCPQCRAMMKPARPVDEGKKVKCPTCGNVFVAGNDRPAKEGAPGRTGGGDKISASPTKGGAAAGGAKPDEDAPGGVYGFAAGEEPVAKPPEPPLEKKKRRREDDDDDEDEDEDDDDDEDEDDEEEVDPVLEMYLKQNRSNNPRGPVTAMLTRPSNYLIITHGLLAILQFLAFTYWIFPLVFSDHLIAPKELRKDPDFPEASQKEYKALLENDPSWEDIEKVVKSSDSKNKVSEKQAGVYQTVFDRLETVDSDRRQERWIQLIFPALLMIYLGFIVYGAVQMQSLESYNWAWTSVIMALIPVASAGAAWTGCYWWRRLLDLDSDSWIFWVPFVLITIWAILAAVLALVTMTKPIVKEAFFYVFE